VVWLIDGVLESRTCPLPMISEWSRAMVRLYGHYKQHFLPFAGGLMEQPVAYVEAMEIIEGANNRIQQERIDNGRHSKPNRLHRRR